MTDRRPARRTQTGGTASGRAGAALLLALAAAPVPALAQQAEELSDRELAARVAGRTLDVAPYENGRIWSPSRSIELHADGRGRVVTPVVSSNLVWKVEGRDLCLAFTENWRDFSDFTCGTTAIDGDAITIVVRAEPPFGETLVGRIR